MPSSRKLRVFLCHASQDKPVVRELRQRLEDEGWIDPWLDEKKLRPGEDWRTSIEQAVESADIVVVCLSHNSVTKEGFVQKEIRYAREISLEKPEGMIFLIPVRLDETEVPRGLRFFQWADYFGETKENAYKELLESFRLRRQQVIRREEERARREAIEKARKEAELRAKREAEELSVRLAQEEARKAAEIQARKEAEQLAQQEAIERERAQAERELARQEAHRQKLLADMYAEAARLSKDGEYQQALEILREIKANDPKYEDRLKIASRAIKKLEEVAVKPASKPRTPKRGAVLLGTGVSIGLLVLLIGLFLLRIFGPPLSFGQPVYLAAMEPSRSVVGYGSLGVGIYPFSEGTIVGGSSLQLNGVEYPHGLFAHAPSEIDYSLPRRFASFSASIYISGHATCGGNGVAAFVVLLDGQEIYRSSELTYGDPQLPIAVSVPLERGNTLTLRTEPLGSNLCDWTVWGDPYLLPSVLP